MCAGVCLGSYVCIEMSVVLLYRTRPYVYSGYTTHTQKHVSGYRFVAVPDPFSPFDLTGPKDGSAWLATLENWRYGCQFHSDARWQNGRQYLSEVRVGPEYSQIKVTSQPARAGFPRWADRPLARTLWTHIVGRPRCILRGHGVLPLMSKILTSIGVKGIITSSDMTGGKRDVLSVRVALLDQW